MTQTSVILLHGLGRSARAMSKMASYLILQGYRVLNLDYASTAYPIEELVERIAPQIEPLRANPIYFVAHSMGSILAHVYIKKYPLQNVVRVVALGPPYHGSAIIDHLGQYRWYQRLHGPAALELTTQPSGICHRLGAINYELGVIAGDYWFFVDWFFARYWLRQPNDGKVEVASTRIEGSRDHMVVPVSHAFLPTHPTVIQQAAYFLGHGYFQNLLSQLQPKI